MDGGVADHHLAGEAVGWSARIAVGAMSHQRRTEGATGQRVLHSPVAGVVPSHVADLDEPTSASNFGLHYVQAGIRCRRQGLLAEHGLARRNRGEHVLLVGRAPGSDEDRVDLAVLDEVLARRVDPSPLEALRRGLSALGINVAERHDTGPGNDVGQSADVVLSDGADPDHAHP